MPNSNCIIIHSWPIVEIGLRTVLQSLKMEVQEVFAECPDCKKLAEWNDAVVLIDIRHWEFIRNHQKILRRRGISIIGIDFDPQQPFDTTIFDEILLSTDNKSLLFSKLYKFSHPVNRIKPTNQLSSREIEVLKLIALGHSNRLISQKLFISIHTVITHRKHITSKLGIKSISGLTLYAILNNLADQP